MSDRKYYMYSVQECAVIIGSDPDTGLTDEEAAARLEKYGKNKLEEGKRKTVLRMFYEQFKSLMIIILLAAALISGFLGEYTDTVIILVVVILNAVLGVLQENKAEKALEALKKMSSPFARVIRGGTAKSIKSEEVVPGDLILIEAGDFIPADIRLSESASLRIEESALTGESVPVEKMTAAIPEADTVVGDMTNMAFLSSSVAYGRGKGIAVGTGMDTEVGKIADLISKAENEETPLQKKLAELGKYLSILVVVISIIIFTAGVLQKRDYFEMFLTAVSLSVAAIPEGLPAIVTIVLALGVQRMAKRNAIIRKLPAVETLGSTEVICSDKTGTLTQNKMTVKEIFLNDTINTLNNVDRHEPGIGVFMQVLALCNDAKLPAAESPILKDGSDEQSAMRVLGDPTEIALVNFAADNGYNKNDMEAEYPRKNEIPFDSIRKLMTTVNLIGENPRILTKGAPDMLVERCSHIFINGEILPLDDTYKEKINAANSDMASKALRVLAMAYRDIDLLPDNLTSAETENHLVFIGLTGMMDPPRYEVKDAVRICREAGMKPVMITGDHRDTATAIAKELSMIQYESEVITGSELDLISKDDFARTIGSFSVYARVSPEHKVRIVEAWKQDGKVVAMTGDGVNDAPALKIADIGVGMGITGTDVAKSVSDMVLSDDNFATIVVAVEEGRKIYSNIRKAIQFLLSANLGEVLTLFAATMLNWTILLPIHILWINLVTDTFPALALGFEKAESDVMKKPPVRSGASFLAGGMGANILYQGILEGIITLAAYFAGRVLYEDNTVAMTVAFATLGLVQLSHAYNVRSDTKSVLSSVTPFNPYLLGAVLISALLQVAVIIIPGLNSIFKVSHLTLEQWGLVVLFSLSIIPMVEIVKLLKYLLKKLPARKP